MRIYAAAILTVCLTAGMYSARADEWSDLDGFHLRMTRQAFIENVKTLFEAEPECNAFPLSKDGAQICIVYASPAKPNSEKMRLAGYQFSYLRAHFHKDQLFFMRAGLGKSEEEDVVRRLVLDMRERFGDSNMRHGQDGSVTLIFSKKLQNATLTLAKRREDGNSKLTRVSLEVVDQVLRQEADDANFENQLILNKKKAADKDDKKT
jgi:hypothetical protein